MENVTVFPRGKGPSSSVSSGKAAKRPLPKEDVLFDARKRLKTIEVAPKKKLKKEEKVGLTPTLGLGMTLQSGSNKVTKIENLTSNKIVRGSLMLGIVLSVSNQHAIVSLPGGHIGKLAKSEVSDVDVTDIQSMKKLVEVNQVLRCCVVGLRDTNSKYVSLSSRASLINRGLALKHLQVGMSLGCSVASREDHGYIMSAGLSNTHFFLPEAEAMKYQTSTLTNGKVLNCVIRDVNIDSKTVVLRHDDNAAQEDSVKNAHLPFLALSCGMLFEVVVDKIVENGLLVSYLNLFHAVIDLNSLPEPQRLTWRDNLKEGLIVQARVVFIDHGSKSVRMSLRPHILLLKAPLDLPALGSKLEYLTITAVNKNHGIVLSNSLSSEDIVEEDNEEEEENKKKKSKKSRRKALIEKRLEAGKQLGVFISKANLRETVVNHEGKEVTASYSVGDQVPVVRVKGYYLVEGLVCSSNMESYLSSEVIHYRDIQIGSVHEVVVHDVLDSGLAVKINDKVDAFCPLYHTADVVIEAKIKKRFKTGQRLKMRVWETSPAGSILMTNKKSLVELDEERSIRFAKDAVIGKHTIGIVQRVTNAGVIVRFFNKLKGFIPISVLSKQNILDPEESFRDNQLVKVVALKATANEEAVSGNEKIIQLAMDMNSEELFKELLLMIGTTSDGTGTEAETGDDKKAVTVPSEACEDIVSGTVYRIEDDCVLVRLSDGRNAMIYKDQCYELAETSALCGLKVGDEISRAAIVGQIGANLLLTLKPLLIHAVLNMYDKKNDVNDSSYNEEIVYPADISELSPGQLVVGTIYKVESYGVMIRFRNNLTAIAPRPNIADRFINSPVGMFNAGDSIRCVVQRIDLNKGRIIVTFKPSLVPSSAFPYFYLSSVLSEQYLRMRSKSEGTKVKKMGSIVQAKVTSVADSVVTLQSQDKSQTFIDRCFSGSVSVDEQMSVVILDVDLQTMFYDVKIFASDDKKAGKKDKAKSSDYSVGDRISVKIQVVKDKYLVVVEEKTRTVGYAAITDYHCPHADVNQYNMGQSILVEVAQLGSSLSSLPDYPFQNTVILRIVSGNNSQTPEKAKSVKVLESNEAEGEAALENNVLQKLTNKLKVKSRSKWVVRSITVEEVTLAPEGLGEEQAKEVNIKGSIYISSAVDKADGTDDLETQLSSLSKKDVRTGMHLQHPFVNYKVGQVMWCQVLHVQEKHTEDNENNSSNGCDELTVYLRPIKSKLEADKDDFHFLLQTWGRDTVKPFTLHNACVIGIEKEYCLVALSPFVSGKLYYADVSKKDDVVKLFKEKCYVGLRVIVVVKRVDRMHGKVSKIHLSRTAIESLLNQADHQFNLYDIKEADIEASLDVVTSIQAGDIITGTLNLKAKKVHRPPAIMVKLNGGRVGRLCVTEVFDSKDWKDFSSLSDGEVDKVGGLIHGKEIKCKVLITPKDANSFVEITSRPSRLQSNKKRALKDDEIPASGSLVKGYICNVSMIGVFVKLSHKLTGRVMIKDLADEFVERPETMFKVGQLVTARVKTVSEDGLQIQLSLRRSEVQGKEEVLEKLQNVQEGDILKGVVQRVADFGVFVQLGSEGKGNEVVGLSRKEQAVEDVNQSLGDGYNVGDVVRVKVLRVSRESGKVSLGLKESFFRSNNIVVEELDAAIAMPVEAMDIGEEVEEKVSKKKRKRAASESSVQSEVPTKAQKRSEASTAKNTIVKKKEEVDLGLIEWDDDINQTSKTIAEESDDDEESDEDEEDDSGGKKPNSKQKGSQRKKEEQLLRERERELASGANLPRKPEDFERMIIAEPNSSLLWVQYIAFYVSAADFEAARLVARRAIRTINFREAGEKFNIWMAWLNLEYKYGNTETLEQTLQEAVQESKGKQIILALAQTYEDSGDGKKAIDLLQRYLKRPQFKKSKKVWMALQRLQLKIRDIKQADETLARSLQSLSKHKHIETISKYALAHFDFGSQDKARAFFEDLIAHYPKRTDLWHLYVDREVKLGNVQQSRQLFERMIAGKANARNMKTVFKKYLALEMKYGDDQSQQMVKEKAAAYVNQLASH